MGRLAGLMTDASAILDVLMESAPAPLPGEDESQEWTTLLELMGGVMGDIKEEMDVVCQQLQTASADLGGVGSAVQEACTHAYQQAYADAAAATAGKIAAIAEKAAAEKARAVEAAVTAERAVAEKKSMSSGTQQTALATAVKEAVAAERAAAEAKIARLKEIAEAEREAAAEAVAAAKEAVQAAAVENDEILNLKRQLAAAKEEADALKGKAISARDDAEAWKRQVVVIEEQLEAVQTRQKQQDDVLPNSVQTLMASQVRRKGDGK